MHLQQELGQLQCNEKAKQFCDETQGSAKSLQVKIQRQVGSSNPKKTKALAQQGEDPEPCPCLCLVWRKTLCRRQQGVDDLPQFSLNVCYSREP